MCKHTQAHFPAHSMHSRCPSAWDTELLSVHPGIARMVNKCVLKHTHTHTHGGLQMQALLDPGMHTR